MPDPSFRYIGQARPVDGRGHGGKGEGWGGAILLLPWGLFILELATRCHVAWGKLNELLLILIFLSASHNLQRKSLHFLLQECSVGEKRRTHQRLLMARPKCQMGNFTNSYRIYKPIRQMSDEPWKFFAYTGSSIMVYARETWTPTSSDLHRLKRNNQAMIHWICNVTSPPRTKSASKISWRECSLMIYSDLVMVLHTGWLRWHGHVKLLLLRWWWRWRWQQCRWKTPDISNG